MKKGPGFPKPLIHYYQYTVATCAMQAKSAFNWAFLSNMLDNICEDVPSIF